MKDNIAYKSEKPHVHSRLDRRRLPTKRLQTANTRLQIRQKQKFAARCKIFFDILLDMDYKDV